MGFKLRLLRRLQNAGQLSFVAAKDFSFALLPSPKTDYTRSFEFFSSSAPCRRDAMLPKQDSCKSLHCMNHPMACLKARGEQLRLRCSSVLQGLYKYATSF